MFNKILNTLFSPKCLIEPPKNFLKHFSICTIPCDILDGEKDKAISLYENQDCMTSTLNKKNWYKLGKIFSNHKVKLR